jgi:hypothetical protein
VNDYFADVDRKVSDSFQRLTRRRPVEVAVQPQRGARPARRCVKPEPQESLPARRPTREPPLTGTGGLRLPRGVPAGTGAPIPTDRWVRRGYAGDRVDPTHAQVRQEACPALRRLKAGRHTLHRGGV